MIDIEAQVYTKVKAALARELKDYSVTLSSIYVNEPSAFPYVSMTESDNSTIAEHLDTGDNEYASLMYEVNVYTVGAKRKTDARTIMKVIDKELLCLNFTRESGGEIPNLQNNSVYRYVARYQCESDGKYTYRR